MEFIPYSRNLEVGWYVGGPMGGSIAFLRKDLANKLKDREYAYAKRIEYSLPPHPNSNSNEPITIVRLTTGDNGLVWDRDASALMLYPEGESDIRLDFPYTRDGQPRKARWVRNYGDDGLEVQYRRAGGDRLNGYDPHCSCDVRWNGWVCMVCWFACCSEAKFLGTEAATYKYSCPCHGCTVVNLEIENREAMMEIPILKDILDIVECREMNYYRKHGKFPDPLEKGFF